MSISPDYVHAKMQAANSHAHNAALRKSGKKYYTPSRNPSDPPPLMMGTPMAVPAEYVAAKMKAEESRAQAKAAGAPGGKGYYTPSRNPITVPAHDVSAKMEAEKSMASSPNSTPGTTDVLSPASLGTPMAVPAEYVWAKEQNKSSRASVTSTSDLRCSEETAYSYDKDHEPVYSGKRSLGRKLKDYLHH